jgi:hypothetical protein
MDFRKNGSLSAFAHGIKTGAAYDGLSKREWLAGMCLQGILSNKSIQRYTLWSAAQSAIMYADQLLECLEKDISEETGLAQPVTVQGDAEATPVR